MAPSRRRLQQGRHEESSFQVGLVWWGEVADPVRARAKASSPPRRPDPLLISRSILSFYPNAGGTASEYCSLCESPLSSPCSEDKRDALSPGRSTRSLVRTFAGRVRGCVVLACPVERKVGAPRHLLLPLLGLLERRQDRLFQGGLVSHLYEQNGELGLGSVRKARWCLL